MFMMFFLFHGFANYFFSPPSDFLRHGACSDPFLTSTSTPVLPKNSAEITWRIEAQGLLKDSPLCDDATPIAAYRGRRLDEPTQTGCHRIPPGRKSHPAGTTRWQTQALH